MNLINRIKVGWKNEEFSKIRKYIRKPAYITFAIAGSIMTLAIIFLFAIGKLEDIIVSMDIRYNSPIFITLAVIVLSVQVGAAFYGVFLSLRKYRRPGGKGIVNVSYNKWTSFNALSKTLDNSLSKNRKSFTVFHILDGWRKELTTYTFENTHEAFSLE